MEFLRLRGGQYTLFAVCSGRVFSRAKTGEGNRSKGERKHKEEKSALVFFRGAGGLKTHQNSDQVESKAGRALEMVHGSPVFRKICSKKVIFRSENGRELNAEVLARLGPAARPKGGKMNSAPGGR